MREDVVPYLNQMVEKNASHLLFSSGTAPFFFFFNDTATTEIYTAQYTLSLHDALPISSLFQSLSDAGLSPVAALRITNSLFLAGTLLAVTAIFWGGIYGMRIVDGKRPAVELARKFAHAFIPIALAYLVAHYFSLVVYQEQAQFTYLLSDPLGDGSDLFGTAGSGIDYGVIGSETIWYVQVAALVIGH